MSGQSEETSICNSDESSDGSQIFVLGREQSLSDESMETEQVSNLTKDIFEENRRFSQFDIAIRDVFLTSLSVILNKNYNLIFEFLTGSTISKYLVLRKQPHFW